MDKKEYLYTCHACGRTVTRDYKKVWFRSWCDWTKRYTRLYLRKGGGG